jgi:signal transduction histidine kinase
MQKISLRGRLVALLIGTVALTAVLTGVFGVLALRLDLEQRFDEELINEMNTELVDLATEALLGDIPWAKLPENGETKQEFTHEGREYALRLTDATGAVLFASQFFEDAEFGVPTEDQGAKFAEAHSQHGTRVRYLTLPILNPETKELYGTLQLGQSTEQIQDAITEELRISSAGVLLAIAIAIVLGLATAKKILKPVRQITQTAEEISLKNLKLRISYKGQHDDELTLLAGTLDHMLDRLDESVERLKQFTSDASHELRTPLTAMAAILDVAASSNDTTTLRQALLDARTEVRNMTKLVEDLLLLARADNAEIKLAKSPVELKTLTEEVIRLLSAEASARSVVLELAPSSTRATTLGDVTRLRQVLINLITNAIKYNRLGGTVNVTISQTGKKIKLAVHDTGIGIAPKDLKKIFHRFYQAKQNRTENGSGLGLAICQKLIAAHDGKIEVASKLGEGTTFTITLPRA